MLVQDMAHKPWTYSPNMLFNLAPMNAKLNIIESYMHTGSIKRDYRDLFSNKNYTAGNDVKEEKKLKSYQL